jgi:hypothetical protein
LLPDFLPDPLSQQQQQEKHPSLSFKPTDLDLSAWKDASLPSTAYASGYANGTPNIHPNGDFGWPLNVPLFHAVGGPFASSPVVPGPELLPLYHPNLLPYGQYAYSPPQVAPAAEQRQGSGLHDLLWDATATSLAQLMSEIKQLSDAIRRILGLSIIDDDAVERIRAACLSLETANQWQQQRQQQPPPQWQQQRQQQPPPPPAENNPVAVLMAILAQMPDTQQT